MKLRPISDEDFLWLFNYINEPHIRENSFNKHGITIQEHYNWYENHYKENKMIKRNVILVNNKRIGIVGIKMEEDKWCIDIGICSDELRKGYALKALKLFIKKNDSDLFAKIIPNNLSSIGLFEKAKFKLIDQGTEYLLYKK